MRACFFGAHAERQWRSLQIGDADLRRRHARETERTRDHAAKEDRKGLPGAIEPRRVAQLRVAAFERGLAQRLTFQVQRQAVQPVGEVAFHNPPRLILRPPVGVEQAQRRVGHARELKIAGVNRAAGAPAPQHRHACQLRAVKWAIAFGRGKLRRDRAQDVHADIGHMVAAPATRPRSGGRARYRADVNQPGQRVERRAAVRRSAAVDQRRERGAFGADVDQMRDARQPLIIFDRHRAEPADVGRQRLKHARGALAPAIAERVGDIGPRIMPRARGQRPQRFGGDQRGQIIERGGGRGLGKQRVIQLVDLRIDLRHAAADDLEQRQQLVAVRRVHCADVRG